MLAPVRVLVVDDYSPWMKVVSAALATGSQFHVVGQAKDGLTALQKVVELKPDLVVLDIGLPDMSGIEVAQQIMDWSPEARILFLSENTAPEIVRAAMLTGARGYVVKSSAGRDLMPALDALLLDYYFVSAAANLSSIRGSTHNLGGPRMPDTNYELFPRTGFTVTHFLVSADIKKSLDFYSRILGGKVVMDGENGKPCVVQLENTWVIINVGGGPTDDKPAVYLRPPKDGEAVSSFMNIRVANIAECYERWKGLGAEFLTEPKVHETETRCYMRDPDGHLIEVGEAKK